MIRASMAMHRRRKQTTRRKDDYRKTYGYDIYLLLKIVWGHIFYYLPASVAQILCLVALCVYLMGLWEKFF